MIDTQLQTDFWMKLFRDKKSDILSGLGRIYKYLSDSFSSDLSVRTIEVSGVSNIALNSSSSNNLNK